MHSRLRSLPCPVTLPKDVFGQRHSAESVNETSLNDSRERVWDINSPQIHSLSQLSTTAQPEDFFFDLSDGEDMDGIQASAGGEPEFPGGELQGRSNVRRLLITCWRNFPPTGPTWSAEAERRCTYIVGQQETCPDTGRVHSHFSVYFRESVKPSVVKRIFEPALTNDEYRGFRPGGTPEQVDAYCTKVWPLA